MTASMPTLVTNACAERQHDEHHHGREEHEAPADLVGQPAAEERADHRSALRSRAGQPEQQRVGMVLVLDEDEDEGDAVQVPGLDQDRGHHQPADAIAVRRIVGDQMADSRVHGGLV